MAKEVKKVTKKTATKKVVKKVPSKKKKVVKKTSKDVIKTEQASIEVDESGITVKTDKPLTIIDSTAIDKFRQPLATAEAEALLDTKVGSGFSDKVKNLRTTLENDPFANVSEHMKTFERTPKRQPSINKQSNVSVVTPFADSSDELYLALEKSLKKIESRREADSLLNNEHIKLLATSASELNSEEVAYITSYIELFKAKKNFEQLRIKVGDFKV